MEETTNPTPDVHTLAGDGFTTGIKHLTGQELATQFNNKEIRSQRYLIWLGDYTAEQLKATEWSSEIVRGAEMSRANQYSGFLGIFCSVRTHNGYVWVKQYEEDKEDQWHTVCYAFKHGYSDSPIVGSYICDTNSGGDSNWYHKPYSGTSHGVEDSTFTLVPVDANSIDTVTLRQAGSIPKRSGLYYFTSGAYYICPYCGAPFSPPTNGVGGAAYTENDYDPLFNTQVAVYCCTHCHHLFSTI